MTEYLTREQYAKFAAEQLLADDEALAAFEVGTLPVDDDVAAHVDAALARRHRDYAR